MEPLCLGCIWGETYEWPKCAAYPDGIPEQFISGEKAHIEPEKGDGGIQFRPVAPDDSVEALDNEEITFG